MMQHPDKEAVQHALSFLTDWSFEILDIGNAINSELFKKYSTYCNAMCDYATITVRAKKFKDFFNIDDYKPMLESNPLILDVLFNVWMNVKDRIEASLYVYRKWRKV